VRTLLGVLFCGDQAFILPINKIAEGRGSPKGRGCQCPLCPQKPPRQRPTGVSAKGQEPTRALEQKPHHSMTSSAIASSVGGTLAELLRGPEIDLGDGLERVLINRRAHRCF
jgi:hypothetical protein